MDLIKPVLVSLAGILAGFLGAVFAGSLVSYELADLLDYFVVWSPAVVAVFASSGVAARVHAEPHRHRPGRHLLAALLGPLVIGVYSSAGVERGVDFEAVARIANFVLPVGAALGGARLLDRRDGSRAAAPALAEPWR